MYCLLIIADAKIEQSRGKRYRVAVKLKLHLPGANDQRQEGIERTGEPDPVINCEKGFINTCE